MNNLKFTFCFLVGCIFIAIGVLTNQLIASSWVYVGIGLMLTTLSLASVKKKRLAIAANH
jgi:hypothetical protein